MLFGIFFNCMNIKKNNNVFIRMVLRVYVSQYIISDVKTNNITAEKSLFVSFFFKYRKVIHNVDSVTNAISPINKNGYVITKYTGMQPG